MNPNNTDKISIPPKVSQPERLALLAALAIIGQVILLSSAWLLPFVSEYSLISDNISELVLGHFGFVQTAAFVISGLTVLGLAYAIRQFTRGGRGSLAGALLVALYGAAAVLTAIFPTDRIDSAADVLTQSPTGMIHAIAALIGFLSLIIAMFVLSWTFAKDPRWRSLTTWSVLLAGGALALFIVQGEGPWVGIMQRGLVTINALWLMMTAFRVRALAQAAERRAEGRPYEHQMQS